MKRIAPGYYAVENDEDEVSVAHAYEEFAGEPAASANYEAYSDERVTAPSGNYEAYSEPAAPSANYEAYSEAPVATPTPTPPAEPPVPQQRYGGDSQPGYHGGPSYGGDGASYGVVLGEDSSGSDDDNNNDGPATATASTSAARDYHGEWKALLSAPSTSSTQRVIKFLQLQRLFDGFAREAARYAKIIVGELRLPAHQRTIRSIDAGGVAGGVKYLHAGIFFKFTFDSEGLYSGDEFAAKAAGRELQGLESYFSHILATGSDLYTAMQMLIDYAGYRLIASSLLPIGKTSLLYGSNDGGASVHADDMRLNKLMKEAGQRLNLKGHMVAGVEIFAPADIEGHRGSDGLYYVLDTARVNPPETPPRYFQALLVPPGGDTVSTVDVPSSGYDSTVAEIVGAHSQRTPFVMGVIFSDPAATVLNARCTAMAGTRINGLALIVPNGWKGKFLYNSLRGEFVRQYRVPLSSDAFSGFGRHDFKTHNEEVAAATIHLKTDVMRKLAEDINAGIVQCANGGQLSEVLHRYGVNVRHLGLLYGALTPDSSVRELIMTEVVTRSAKQLLRSVMREAKSPAALAADVTHHLNMLLGAGEYEELQTYWDVLMRLVVRSKFSIDCQRLRNRALLFQRLTSLLGISFGDDFVLRETRHPFDGAAMKLEPRIKTLIRNQLDASFRALLSSGSELTADGMRQIRKQVTHAQEGCCCDLQLASLLVGAGQLDEARATLVALVKTPDLLSVELRLTAVLLLTRIMERLAEPWEQRLSLLLRARDVLVTSKWFTATGAILVDEIVHVMHQLHKPTLAYEHAVLFASVCGGFYLDLTVAQMRRVFNGRSAPASLVYVLAPDAVTDAHRTVLDFWLRSATAYDRALTMLDLSTLCGPLEWSRDHALGVLEREVDLFSALPVFVDPLAREQPLPMDIENYTTSASVLDARGLWASRLDWHLHYANDRRSGYLFNRDDNQSQGAFPVFLLSSQARDGTKGRFAPQQSTLRPAWPPQMNSDAFFLVALPSDDGYDTLFRCAPAALPAPAPLLPSTLGADVAWAPSGGYYAIDGGAIMHGGFHAKTGAFAVERVTVAAGVRFRALVGAGDFWCAVSERDEVYTWGAGGLGQLGHGLLADAELPRHVNALQAEKIVAVAAHSRHTTHGVANVAYTVALSTTGQLYIWGTFSTDSNAVAAVTLPTKMHGPASTLFDHCSCGGLGVAAISRTGMAHFAFFDLSGAKASQGDMVAIEELQQIVFIRVAVGDTFALFLASDGRVYIVYDGEFDRSSGFVPSLRQPGGTHLARYQTAADMRLDVPVKIVSIRACGDFGALLGIDGSLYLLGAGERMRSMPRRCTTFALQRIVSSVPFAAIASLTARGNILARVGTPPNPLDSSANFDVLPPLFLLRRVSTEDEPVHDLDVFVIGQIVSFEITLPAVCRIGRNFGLTDPLVAGGAHYVDVPSDVRPLTFVTNSRILGNERPEGSFTVGLRHNGVEVAHTTLRCVKVHELDLAAEFQIHPVSRVFYANRYQDQLIIFARARKVPDLRYNFIAADGSPLLSYALPLDGPVVVSYIHMHPPGDYTLQLQSESGVVGDFGKITILPQGDGTRGTVVIPSAGLLKLHECWRLATLRSMGWQGVTIEPAVPGVPLVWDGVCTAKWRVDLRKIRPPAWAALKIETAHTGFAITLTDRVDLPFFGEQSDMIKFNDVTNTTVMELETRYKTDSSLKAGEKLWAHFVVFGAVLSTLPVSLAVCEIEIVSSAADARAAYERKGLPIPDELQEKSALEFGCAFEDPDVYYYSMGQQVKLSFAMDKSFGMAHNVLVLPRGVRDITKMRTACMVTSNPTMFYVPLGGTAEQPEELDIVCAYMETVKHTWVYSQPLCCAVVPEERDARLLNRKRQQALKPPPPTPTAETAAPPAPPVDPDDEEAVMEVVKHLKPPARAAAVRERLLEARVGRALMPSCSYTVLRQLGFEPDVCGAVLVALDAVRRARVAKLPWTLVLADVALPGDADEVAGKLDAVLPLPVFLSQPDAMLLRDVAALEPAAVARAMQNAQQLKLQYKL